MIRIAMDKKSLPSDSRDLVRFFDAVERIGYVMTALQVYRERPIRHSLELTTNVLYNQGPKLLPHARAYRSIRAWIAEHADTIHSAIALLDDCDLVLKNFQLVYGLDMPDAVTIAEHGKDTSPEHLASLRATWEELL